MDQKNVNLLRESAISLSLILASKRRLSQYIAFNFLLQIGVQSLRALVKRILSYDEKILKGFSSAVALSLIGAQGIAFGRGDKRRIQIISGAYFLESIRILLAARDQQYWDDRIRYVIFILYHPFVFIVS
uniref:Uncharacterized protein n=1 Tax=Aplanochytrium stocchinoi TaxID=215587 RepID=A0A7S3PK00_9STRA